jgi:hypothetical protein
MRDPAHATMPLYLGIPPLSRMPHPARSSRCRANPFAWQWLRTLQATAPGSLVATDIDPGCLCWLKRRPRNGQMESPRRLRRSAPRARGVIVSHSPSQDASRDGGRKGCAGRSAPGGGAGRPGLTAATEPESASRRVKCPPAAGRGPAVGPGPLRPERCSGSRALRHARADLAHRALASRAGTPGGHTRASDGPSVSCHLPHRRQTPAAVPTIFPLAGPGRWLGVRRAAVAHQREMTC